jgi:hypothetical protein
MSPSLPYWRCRRRARERTSSELSAGVSSMCIGASLSRPTAAVPLPVLVEQPAGAQRCWSRRDHGTDQAHHELRRTHFHREHRDGQPVSSATFSAMFSENAVLPIDGRPATITRSPG